MPYVLVASCLVGSVLLAALVTVIMRIPREIHAFRRIQRSSIGELPARVIPVAQANKCRIVGQVRALSLEMRAPLANVPCVYYRLRIHHNIGGTRRVAVDVDDCVAFVVDDGTGTLVVDPRGSVMVSMRDHRSRIRRAHELSPRERALLTRFGVALDGSYELEETLLRVGRRVAVVGTPAREFDRTKLAKRYDADLLVTYHRQAITA